MIRRILINKRGKTVQWKVENNKKVKLIVNADDDRGVIWNRDRKEDCIERLQNIEKYNFTNNFYCNEIRKIIIQNLKL